MTTSPYQIVIGTAGHIDHGKTALVYALTGDNTDRLAEEQERGMTIDLGFAFLTSAITIIDVPGHEKFIRNMVAGVATIDCALLVIAADDGIMPQTMEHVQIMNLLGIRHGVIALTKIDLIDDHEWLDLVEADIRQAFQATFLSEAPIIRVSNTTGTGIADVKSQLQGMAKKVGKKQDRGYFRLPVDRVFTKSGFGTVVTGTVISGDVRLNDTVEIAPQMLTAKVRGIQSHGQPVELGRRGDRLALNLANVDTRDLDRGTEILSPGRGKVTERFIAHITLLPDTDWTLKPRQRVHIHIGTAEFLARIWIPSILKPGEKKNAVFTLEKPAVITNDDHFIMRSYSPMVTIGGGVVLAGNPGDKWKTIKEVTLVLPADPQERFGWLVHHNRHRPQTPAEWAITMQQSRETINTWISALTLIENDTTGFIYSRDDFQSDCANLVHRVQAFHRKHPYRKWIGRKQLLDDLGYDPKWFSVLVNDCLKRKVLVTDDSGLRLPDHEIKLRDEDKNQLHQIKAWIEKQHFAMAGTKDIESELGLDYKRLQDLLFILKDRGDIIEITGNTWLAAAVFNELLEKLTAWFKTHDTLSVSDFKDLSGLSRKSAIPLLEYLDRFDYTFRVENHRKAGENLNRG